jgi:filamentous hemagglutinin family protein
MRKSFSTKVLITASLIPFFLIANPTGHKIISGDVAISSFNNNECIIQQNSNKAVVDWENFSIQENEITKFVQPSSSSAILNRVIGNDMSQIYGTLQSNGQVYLINPNGWVIGPKGFIDTQGFIASTLDLKNEEFLSQDLWHFSGLSNAKIINNGKIIAQNNHVLLIANEIENNGSIVAKNGNVDLMAGYDVLLVPSQDNKVSVGLKKEGQITNKGFIEAVETKLQASGGNAYSLAINHEGVIDAIGIAYKDGKAVLISDATTSTQGKILAQNANETGGKIQILGQDVKLEKATAINASGKNGGGEILVGGDYQGKNPDIQNAKTVYVDKEALIKADALENGNGGKVIIWGNERNDYFGHTSVGAQNGDGGLIEVSSPLGLNYRGTINAISLNGKVGTLLLDPEDITIDVYGGIGTSNPAWTNPYTPVGPPSPAELAVADLTNALLGANVIVNTNGAGAGSGGITVNTQIISASGFNLTLNAEEYIHLVSKIDITGVLSLNFAISGSGTNLSVQDGVTASGGIGSMVNGGGNGSLDISAYSTDVTFNITGNKSGNCLPIGNFTNVASVFGGLGTNTVSLSTIGGDNTVTISGINQVSTFNMDIYNIANLYGGSGNNNFIMNSGITGTIDGVSAGTNRLDYSNYSGITVDLEAGTATGTGGVSNIYTIAVGPSNGGANTLTGKNNVDCTFEFSDEPGPLLFPGSVTGGTGANNTISFVNRTSISQIFLSGPDSGAFNPAPSNFSNIQNFIGGSGDNTLTIQDGGSLSGTFNGGAGVTNTLDYSNYSTNISVNLQTGIASEIGSFSNINAVTGSAIAYGTLTSANTPATWTIIADYTGTGTGDIISFSNIDNLTCGNGGNTFDVNGSMNSITLGNGTNVVTMNSGTITTLNGGTGSNTVIGPNDDVAWDITGNNAGSMTSASANIPTFTGIRSLTGNNGNDTFYFHDASHLSGNLNGEGGINTLNYMDYHADVHINLHNNTTTLVDGTVTNIQNGAALSGDLIGGNFNDTFYIYYDGNVTGGTGTNTLVSMNNDNTWTITGPNAGTIQTVPPPVGLVTFSQIQRLQGGGQSDTFIIPAHGLIESINGDGGNDTIIAPNAPTTWTIDGTNSGNFHGSGTTVFNSIENLTAGGDNDTFYFYPGAQITGTLDGGAGTNVLDLSNYGSAVKLQFDPGSSTAGIITDTQGTVIQHFINIQQIILPVFLIQQSVTEAIVATVTEATLPYTSYYPSLIMTSPLITEPPIQQPKVTYNAAYDPVRSRDATVIKEEKSKKESTTKKTKRSSKF